MIPPSGTADKQMPTDIGQSRSMTVPAITPGGTTGIVLATLAPSRAAAFAGLASYPFVAGAEQASLPVVGFVNAGSADGSVSRATAFLKGLGEAGYVDGQNVKVEYHWLEGKNESLLAIMTDLVRRQVAVISTPGSVVCSLAAKAATEAALAGFKSSAIRSALGIKSCSRRSRFPIVSCAWRYLQVAPDWRQDRA